MKGLVGATDRQIMTKKEDQQTQTVVISQNGSSIRRDVPLPQDHLEQVDSWGEATTSMSYVYRPSTIAGLKQVFDLARDSGRSIGLRGAGNSYGDATLNNENIILDLQRMNRILDWNPESGQIRVEPGVTIAKLWEYALEDGWWPAVVPGTAKPTIGGCAGMNVHGKNAWKVGTIGDQISSFEILLPSGEICFCSREQNQELFIAAIGGFGMLGIFTSITLQLKRIQSGLLEVHALASHDLAEMMQQFDEYLDQSDYLVGWIDGFAKGKSLGRGQIHRANYLTTDQDPQPGQTLRLENQHLADTMFGLVPRSIMWRFMRPFFNDHGARFINWAKYMSSLYTHDSRFRQPHVAFHFLLDYVPNWKRSYGDGGLIQYQCFVPKANALHTFTEIIRHCHKRKLINYLAVLKRHKRDDFHISHGVDGYSLAMDFRITPKRKARLQALTNELDEIVLQAGGRFYFAKDSTLQSKTVEAFLGASSIDSFKELKKRHDPENILQTNMWRRFFGE